MKNTSISRGNRSSNRARGGESKRVVVSDQFSYIEPVQAKHLEVQVFGNFERALRTFRSLVQKERILSSYKERQHYEKPSDKKRRKINESKRKQLEFCSKGECVHTEHVSNRKRSE